MKALNDFAYEILKGLAVLAVAPLLYAIVDYISVKVIAIFDKYYEILIFELSKEITFSIIQILLLFGALIFLSVLAILAKFIFTHYFKRNPIDKEGYYSINGKKIYWKKTQGKLYISQVCSRCNRSVSGRSFLLQSMASWKCKSCGEINRLAEPQEYDSIREKINSPS